MLDKKEKERPTSSDTTTAKKNRNAHLRSIDKEKEIESKIAKMLRVHNSSRFIILLAVNESFAAF
jgi:hypothetical protein